MAVEHLEITCSRCGGFIPGIKFIPEKEGEPGATSGYYEVGPDKGWSKYARPGEIYLCDNYMLSSPEYQKDYSRGD